MRGSLYKGSDMYRCRFDVVLSSSMISVHAYHSYIHIAGRVITYVRLYFLKNLTPYGAVCMIWPIVGPSTS